MHWSLSECHPNSAFEHNGVGFVNPNFCFQSCENYSSRKSEDGWKEQRKKDQDFISNFILEVTQKKKNNSKGNVKISDGKRIFLEIIKQKQNFKEQIANLNVSDEDFEGKCETLLAELNKINNRILEFNSDVKTGLAAALKKRSKKRKAIKKRKENQRALKELLKQKIKENHKAIDQLLNEKSEEVENIKYEAALKRQADTVLHEVRRKKYEGKKMLNLLIALGRLRELRSSEEKKRGGYASEQLRETFNNVMSRFQNLWEKQLEVYKLEEKGLKIMLEESVVPHKKEPEFERNLLQWEKALFGDITNEKNARLLSLPETDFSVLIGVRKDWDQFLTEDSTLASGIPPGWVLPPETEDELWKAFTKNNLKPSPVL